MNIYFLVRGRKEMNKFTRFLSAALAVSVLAGATPLTALAEDGAEQSRQVSAEEVQVASRLDGNVPGQDRQETVYSDDELVTVIVQLEAPAVMDYYGTSTYAASAEETSAGQAVSAYLASADAKAASQQLLADQQSVIDSITSLAGSADVATMAITEDDDSSDGIVVAQWSSLVNGMAVEVPYGLLDDIRAMDGVKRAYVEHVYDRPITTDSTVDPDKAWYSYSYDKVNLGQAWAEGYTGKGMLVAVLDTGLDLKWSYMYDDEGNESMGVTRCHEAFRDDSFKSGDPLDPDSGWDLRYTSDSLAAFLKDNQLNSTTGSEGGQIEYQYNALYKNLKVPYACDYADGDINVLPTNSDHGTHVAGTIAGYAATDEGEELFSGIAPDAQLMIMKVFPDADGGAAENTVVTALEDSLKLGADVVNLSLGSDNGFADDDTMQNEIYATVEAAGIPLLTSAGNSGYSSAGNNYGGEPLTSDVDTAMMSSPAIYESNLSVASLENAIQAQPYMTWTAADGSKKDVAYTDPWTVGMRASFADGQEYPVYLVDGYGESGDYYNVGWYNEYNNPNGKTGFALVKRGGGISFADKVMNAQSYSTVVHGETKGILGVIVYDENAESTELINMSVENTSLPSAFINGVDGAAMVEALEGGYEVKITVSDEDQALENPTDGQMSTFSSWGAGPSLELKPEITAPGGNIWSTVLDQINTDDEGYTGSYSMMSGTSMAAPHITGVATLVRQRIESDPQFEGLSSGEVADLVNQMMVSTAVPQKDTEGVYYSPRQQGAGLVNAGAAVTTPVYVTVEGQNVGKLELKDDPDRTGSYPISFDLHNISDQDVTYNVTVTLQRPATSTADSAWGQEDVALHQDVVIKTVDLGQVTVPAGQSVSFDQSVSLTSEEKAALDSLFENGVYVEGFVSLADAASAAPTLGLPMLAYYGDWTEAPIFDSALWIDEPADTTNVNNNQCTWGVSVVGSTVQNPMYGIIDYLNLGQNVFDSTSNTDQTVYHPENITISPNGDEYFDRIDDYVLYQLRDAKVIVVKVTDQETGEVYFSDWTSYITRTLYNSSYGVAFPFSSYAYGLVPGWDGTDMDGNVLPSGTKCTFTITAYGDGEYGDKVYEEETGLNVTDFDSVAAGSLIPTFNGHQMNMTGDVISFPVTVDTVAPKLENNAVSFYEKDGRTYMTGTVYDEDGTLASIEIVPYVVRSYKEGYGDPNYSEVGIDQTNPFLVENLYEAGKNLYTFTADVTEYVRSNESFPGENNYYNFEWTGNVLLSCGDYGANDRSYAITVDSTEGLVLSQTSALLHPGSSFDLSVIDNTGDDAPITRTSSNPEVATVDETGKVTAIAPGQAIITVSNGVSSAICVVAVEEYHTEVESFDLSLDEFCGLKPDGSVVVKVENLQPADVQLNDIKWIVEESDETAEYAEGLIQVEQYDSSGLGGTLYLSVSSSQVAIPEGNGTLTVSLNGVSRSMDIDWIALYTSETQDDLISDVNMGDQVLYVQPGESAQLLARYRQSSQHEANLVDASELVGVKLDGPDFFHIGGSYDATLVNEAGYDLPAAEDVHLYVRYNNGTEVELVNYDWYHVYTYDPATGKLHINYCPSGADNVLVIRAQGKENPNAEAGTMSGVKYERPDALYGPFNWTVTEGTGNLELKNTTVSSREVEAAYYTPSEPGVSTITATTKDGKYSVNFAVVCQPVKADTIEMENHNLELETGETAALITTLSPTPTLAEDAKLNYRSFDPTVATVDENGNVTGVKEGYAYIQITSAADNTVESYAIVHVTTAYHTVQFVDYDGTVLKEVQVAHGNGAIAPEDPQREGYTFVGWDVSFDQVTADLVVTALYEPIRYTVSFVADGQTVATVQKDYGTTLTDADYPAVPAKEGYTGAWQKVTDPVTGDITIQAVYTINHYLVTFMADGQLVSSMSVEHGYRLTDADYPAIPARAGYSAAWQKVTDPITGNTTVQAVYTADSTGSAGSAGSAAGSSPATGDSSLALAAAVAMAGALAAFGALSIRRKKED